MSVPKREVSPPAAVSFLGELEQETTMPTRYLKSGIRDSESIENLSPIAENLYYRLLVTVDDFGRYDARPAMIKAACFPIKDSINAIKTEALLKELAQHGLIEIYVDQDKPFLQMTKWDNIPRAKESKYPSNLHDAMQVYADVCNTHTDVPLTKTETETKTETKTAPEGVSPEVWDSFVKQRKASRAVITDSVIKTIKTEADKAGWTLEQALSECAARGWRGFKAEWVMPKPNPADRVRLTVAPSNEPDPALEKIKADALKAAPIPLEVLAKMAELRRKA
jgi:hypothetical protein